MRAIQGGRAIGLAAVLGVCMWLAIPAHALSDTERAGSILIFTKVVSGDGRDTLIQITNTGNPVNRARCYYLNGETCAVTDFEIALTKQQPTHWWASTGRRVNPLDSFGSDGAGLDPGRVPPVGNDFEGALICVEVSVDGAPVPMNKLKGEATLVDVSGSAATNNTSTYNAIAFGGVVRDMDKNLELETGTNPEYAACSDRYRVNFYSLPNQSDPYLGSNSSVVTNLTVLPCNLDLSRRTRRNVSLFFRGWDEFEGEFSAGVTFDGCWANVNLNSLFGFGIASPFGTVDVEATVGGPVLLLQESFFADQSTSATASAANNVHQTGRDQAAVIRIP